MTKFRASNIIIHITGWLIFLSLPLLFITGMPGSRDLTTVLSSHYYWLFLLFYLAVFYTNTWLFIPRLYLKKRPLVYMAVLLLVLAVAWWLRPFDHLLNSNTTREGGQMVQQSPPPPHPPGETGPPPGAEERPGFRENRPPPGPLQQGSHPDFVSMFLVIMMLALGMAVQVTHRWRISEQRAARAEADKANAELSFLKAQINPHFLFNTLNNIYSLAVTHNEHTADSIMKLSNIMRYVSDDVLQDWVPLRDETNCISDYIDLQRLRLGEKTWVVFDVSGDTEHIKIAPLLLMTFVENAFKYGTSNHQDSQISIRLQTEAGSTRFSCSNKIFTTRQQAERTGIGITNTRQRLEHLYPGKYVLTITNDDGFFNVQLVLQA
ncbi:MAG TPA: histidine kinase [Chitinophagaceae bacterium]